MTKYPLILLMVAGVVLHAAAMAFSAPPPAATTLPPSQIAPAAPRPSLEADAQKLVVVMASALDAGWQRVSRTMDEFFRLPPESPPPADQPAPSSPATTASAAPAAPPPAPASPPIQAAVAVPPAAAPASLPPLPPQTAAPVPPPASKPAVAVTAPPAQPPAPAQVASVSAADSKPPSPSPAPVPPALISSLPVQPAAPSVMAPASSSATQVVINPTKTSTNPLKYLVAKYAAPSQSSGRRANSLVTLDVHRIVKRKYLPDATDNPALGWMARAHYRETASLHITVENLSPQLLTNVVVQWGVVKKSVARDSTTKPVVFGTNETVTLKPLDVKSIETAPVEVEGRIDQSTGRGSGDIIRGHAVQVLVGTNVIAEEFFPATLKISFKELQPVPKPLPPIQQ